MARMQVDKTEKTPVPEEIQNYVARMIAFQTDFKRGPDVRDVSLIQHVLNTTSSFYGASSYPVSDLHNNLKTRHRLMTFAAALNLTKTEFDELHFMASKHFSYKGEPIKATDYEAVKDRADIYANEAKMAMLAEARKADGVKQQPRVSQDIRGR